MLEYKELGNYNKALIEAITGLLMSDGHLRNTTENKKNNKPLLDSIKTVSKSNFRMDFTFKIINAEKQSMMGFNN
jgi:hypothetical protein